MIKFEAHLEITRMIGVLCHKDQRKIVQEFFELFKTPWEFFDSTNNYDVILSTRGDIPENNAKLKILYSSDLLQVDVDNSISLDASTCSQVTASDDTLLPIYGTLANLCTDWSALLHSAPESRVVAAELVESGRKTIRVGFDLFAEVAFLISEGQPIENAFTPTLECHISMLRSWIVSAGISLVEIPPIPLGHNFFACLTHDVDFVGISRHKFDHTMWGFVYRAVVGSAVALLKGRIRISKLLENWIAVVKLPFVYAGVADDFWEHFDNYADLEEGLSSTFFLIPFKNYSGDATGTKNLYRRATHYDVGDVGKQVKHLTNLGFEIGLHGIDAWTSSEKGSQELKRIAEATGKKEVGVRIHWLYYNHQSPFVFEQAGFEYDSTLGYNETIGFKNGTLQVFKPMGVSRLLEIPLNIQDTALFYPRRLNLSDADAKQLCNKLLDAACLHGGVLTISWHERSLEPERLWGDFYKCLLRQLRSRGAWIGSAQQIVKWFRRRRSIAFGNCRLVDNKFEINLVASEATRKLPMLVRLHIPSQVAESLGAEHSESVIDIPWRGESFLVFSIGESEIK